MDIEWCKDGDTGKLYIVQARPETVHSLKKRNSVQTYHLTIKGKLLCTGKAVGRKIISGRACIIHSLADAGKLKNGDILIADITNPDWNALLRKAVSIVTNKGGRTSHASIVARELGIPAIVGTGNATEVIADGQLISVVNVEGEDGMVMDGAVAFHTSHTDFDQLPAIDTRAMLILADPDRAFELASYPAGGVGLLRMEFIINNSILIHPMALLKFDELPEGKDKSLIAGMTAGYSSKAAYFVEKLSESVAKVAAAFYPRPVIVRMSDFKTNEYASLLGGAWFEPKEENPMIGFRGASRYYDNRYREGFGLECAAMKRVRETMGLDNVKLMIPFCRTLEEAKRVLATMQSFGLKRGEKGLRVYMMVEIPSNVMLADQFATLFDGFSIGSNDLTQLTLGLDRDSEIVSHLFNEENEAVTSMIARAIEAAKKAHIDIGLCGQAPSDFPGFSRFLVQEGIDSISFTPDALFRGIENIARAEALPIRPQKALIGYD
jgi:pyruvate,water dikinase